MTENPTEQGRRPWVRFERDQSPVTVHTDRYRNEQDHQVMAVEDDASRSVFELVGTDARSADRSAALLDAVRDQYETAVAILEVVTDHSGAFVAPHRDQRPAPDHAFGEYLAEHDIRHTVCTVGRP